VRPSRASAVLRPRVALLSTASASDDNSTTNELDAEESSKHPHERTFVSHAP